MANQETSFGWVFDSLVGFLKGPIWETAVLTFIEQKSVVFDPLEGNEEEYKKLHEEYKRLVDTMLSSHMEDLGITADQFEQACTQTEKNIHSQFRKSLFEQIWAADSYDLFKRMMTQKNLELQLQALELLAHQYGIVPNSFVADQRDQQPSKEERQVMQAVLKRYEEAEKPAKTDPEEKQVIIETKVQLEKALEQQLQHETVDSKTTDFSKTKEVSPEEAKRRAEYLKQQRDKLLALKRQEREKQLKAYEGASSRPKSARAAQKAVQQQQEEDGKAEAVDSKMLAFRKSLAARLKAEVVDQNAE